VTSPPAATVKTRRRQQASIRRILKGKSLYSQHNEELIIRHFLKDRRNGFFVDVGCSSPIVASNTYYLEHHLGWSGIGIDALAEYEPAWRLKRPRSKFFAYFVSDHSDPAVPFYRSEQRGASSLFKENVANRVKDGEKVDFSKIGFRPSRWTSSWSKTA
jgi:hypothetical protein